MGKQVAANFNKNKRDRKEPESYEIERAVKKETYTANLERQGSADKIKRIYP